MSQRLSPSSFFLRPHHHHPPGTKALAAPSPRPWPHQTGLCPSLPRSLCGPRTSQWAAQAAHGNCWKVQGRRERGCLGPRGRRERPSSGVLLSPLPLPAVGTCRACLPRPAWWPPGAAARSVTSGTGRHASEAPAQPPVPPSGSPSPTSSGAQVCLRPSPAQLRAGLLQLLGGQAGTGCLQQLDDALMPATRRRVLSISRQPGLTRQSLGSRGPRSPHQLVWTSRICRAPKRPTPCRASSSPGQRASPAARRGLLPPILRAAAVPWEPGDSPRWGTVFRPRCSAPRHTRAQTESTGPRLCPWGGVGLRQTSLDSGVGLAQSRCPKALSPGPSLGHAGVTGHGDRRGTGGGQWGSAKPRDRRGGGHGRRQWGTP